MLIGRLADYLRKPVFEIMSYPESELLFWMAFFSIQDNDDKPIVKPRELVVQETITVEDSIAAMREALS